MAIYGNTLYIPPVAQDQYHLAFYSNGGEFTISTASSGKNWDGTLEYSADTQTWTVWDGSSALRSMSGALYLRGIENDWICAGAPDEFARWIITPNNSQDTISVIGNIECLLDWQDVANNRHPPMEATCFHDLFRDCTSLAISPKLPATTLANSCYSNMFRGCTNLISAPKLPATTLANDCYYGMFQGCTSLQNAPKLPATTLANNCYSNMFYGCTSLAIAPELPAETMMESCYATMFTNCTSLVNTPELPSQNLNFRCYASMFEGCTSLITAPRLPSMVAPDWCYNSMFKGCTNLMSAPELPATALGVRCYTTMFRDCTSLVAAPKLPATTLLEGTASSCYNGMFYGCTSLVSVPELPATRMASNCYEYMFGGCISLKMSETQGGIYQYPYRVPSSGTGIDANKALNEMFSGTGGTFIGTPNINTTYYTDHEPIPAT